jgi:hypothetical protein
MVYVWCTARTTRVCNALKHCGFVIYAPYEEYLVATAALTRG